MDSEDVVRFLGLFVLIVGGVALTVVAWPGDLSFWKEVSQRCGVLSLIGWVLYVTGLLR